MYEEHFGLAKKPFQLSPDASFFFPSAEHTKALSFLQYGLSQGDGFIVITGNVGTGKTTLVQALVGGLDQRDLAVATIVTSNLAESDLLGLVAADFGLDVGGQTKAQQINALKDCFIEHANEGRRVLIIVDEAQSLPPKSIEELRMLSNFVDDGKPLVQIFLLGQQEFRTTLLSEGFEQLRQRVIATYHLNPLSEEETQTYIEHRLSIAGWQGNPSFSMDAFRGIFEFTEGVPRRINNTCDRLLLFSYLESLNEIDASVVSAVVEEIGSEFWGGSSTGPEPVAADKTGPAEIFDTPALPLEPTARSVFDKADVQRRIDALERAVDGLGNSIKPELGEIREELGFLRLMIDDLLHEMRELSGSISSKGSKKSA